MRALLQFVILFLYSSYLFADAPTADQIMLAKIDQEQSWQFACRVLEVDCSNLTRPTVKTSTLFENFGAFGVFAPNYFGVDVVVIDSGLLPLLKPEYIQAVVAHEMAHYIDYQRGIMSDDRGTCATEWNGWRVENAYLLSHGYGELTDYNWQERYNCFGAGENDGTSD